MSRDADRAALAANMQQWLAAGGVIEQLPPDAGKWAVDAFNPTDNAYEAPLPAIATVDG